VLFFWKLDVTSCNKLLRDYLDAGVFVIIIIVRRGFEAPLQRIQNVAARLVLKLDHRTPVKPALQRLHMFIFLLALIRIEFKIATLMHAIHHQRGPAYLSNMVQFNIAESGRRQFRSSTTFVVRTWTQIGKRAFSVCGPSIWNQILWLRQAPDRLSVSITMYWITCPITFHIFVVLYYLLFCYYWLFCCILWW